MKKTGTVAADIRLRPSWCQPIGHLVEETEVVLGSSFDLDTILGLNLNVEFLRSSE